MLTLAVDTSSKTESVAILEDRAVIAETSRRVMTNHAASLLLSIEEILKTNSVKIGQIDLFAVTVGPGSFTGLRIGAGTVKGLALATGKPVTGVSTLESLVYNISPTSEAVCPFIDAQRNEVYTALYRIGFDPRPEKILDEVVTQPESFLKQLHGNTVFLGDGVEKHYRLIKEVRSDKAVIAPPNFHYVRASAVGLIGIELFSTGVTLDLVTFTPRYLRMSQAETGYSDERRLSGH